MPLGNAGSGQLVPVYTTEEVKRWVESSKDGFSATAETILLVTAAIGVVVMAAGIIQLMREGRDPTFGGGGADRAPGKWMCICGGALGALGSIMYFLVGVMKVGS
jgi:hypothetical protein